MADGTVARIEPSSEEQMARSWEPLHLRAIGTVDLNGRESAQVELARGIEGVTTLYIDAQGGMTAEQARTFAAYLLEGAASLEALG